MSAAIISLIWRLCKIIEYRLGSSGASYSATAWFLIETILKWTGCSASLTIVFYQMSYWSHLSTILNSLTTFKNETKKKKKEESWKNPAKGNNLNFQFNSFPLSNLSRKINQRWFDIFKTLVGASIINIIYFGKDSCPAFFPWVRLPK